MELQYIIGLGYKVISFNRILTDDDILSYSEYGTPNGHFTYVYICPWNVSYSDALEKLEQKYIKENSL